MTTMESNNNYDYLKLYVDEIIDKKKNLLEEINRVIRQI